MDWAIFFLKVCSFSRSGHHFTIYILWIYAFGFLCISSTFFFMAIWFCFWNKITVYIKRLVEITMNKRNIISIYAYTYTQTLQKNTCISVANINIWIISKDRNSRQTLGHPKCASQKIINYLTIKYLLNRQTHGVSFYFLIFL